MATSENDWVGQILANRYRLVRRIGRGGSGIVFDAIQEDLGRRVAVKLLNDARLSEPSYVRRLEREARTTAALNHPHIVQVTDFQHLPGEPPLLVMEYLEGTTVAAEIRKEKRLSPDRVIFITHQVLSALGAAHETGTVHRDVKPANVFLTTLTGVRDIAKVLDFGIAKSFRPEEGALSIVTETGVVFGTPAFMSPEQVVGLPLDGRSDIFSVGTLMYCCLAGRPPFAKKHPLDIMHAVAEESPPSLGELRPDLDPRLIAIVEKAMEKEPGNRYFSAQLMREALEPLGVETTDLLATYEAETRRFARRSSAPPPQPTAPTAPDVDDPDERTQTDVGSVEAALAALQDARPAARTAPATGISDVVGEDGEDATLIDPRTPALLEALLEAPAESLPSGSSEDSSPEARRRLPARVWLVAFTIAVTVAIIIGTMIARS